jgi:hypothetical protein
MAFHKPALCNGRGLHDSERGNLAMRLIKRWLAPVAFGLIVLAVTAAGHARAAGDPVRLVADALLEFEQNVTWESVDDSWRAKRDRWVADVQEASAPADLARRVMALEKAMAWDSVKEAWRKRRDGWVDEMQAANSAANVAGGLLELEQATLWSAVTPKWRSLRDPWVEQLQSVQ